MKRFGLFVVVLAAAAGTAYGIQPVESERLATMAVLRLREGVEGNPVPVFIALGTFLFTVGYHKAKGKSLRESVEVAATRVTLVPVPREGANAVVQRAQARATRAQLLADQIGLENRLRKLPDAILKAEKDVCYNEQASFDAELALEAIQIALVESQAKLEAMRNEKARGDAELRDIAAELDKLAVLV